ncbi:MAG: ComEC/Rec2 family competence protein, partial [Candidatus Latescibacteria bacterium]|nr:ComEC/Rec2 family competence protein [Candidatus Latescibacterota bacterium]
MCGTLSALLAILLVLLGALRWTHNQGVDVHSLSRFLPFIDSSVEIVGQVVSEPESVRDDRRVVLAVKQLTLQDTVWFVQGRVLLRLRKGVSEVSYGDRLHLALEIYQASPPRNPGAFDYRAYLKRRGIVALGSVRKNSQIHAVEHGLGDWWSRAILPVRQTIRAAIEHNLSGGPAGLLKGVLLGEKHGIPDHIKNAFARTGVNHVLAVSGLHVGLIAGVVFFMCKMLGLGRYGTSGLTMCALILYAMVTGLPPSVVRASTMGCVALIGVVGQRDLDGGNILGIAGLALLIGRPQDFLDVGFQLSFAATGGILLFYQPLRDMLPLKKIGWCEKWLAGPLAVSVAAQIITLPFVVS